MKFSRKKLPKSEIAIEMQLDEEELDKKKPEAIGILAKNLRIEGFRPGRAPLPLAEKHLSDTAILEEAARIAITEAYGNVVRKENLDVIGDPEVQVLKLAPGNPLEFRIQVAVLPGIELPDYKKIAGKSTKRNVVVEEKEVEDALKWLRESKKTKDGVTPEATTEFAQGLGNFADLKSLRQSIQEGLRHEKEIQERDRLRQEIIEKIAEQSKLEIPDVLVSREKQVLISGLKQDIERVLQISFEAYLQKAGKTEQELVDSFAQEAEQRVKRFLVVREVAKKEGIGATQEEITKEAAAMLEHYANAKQDIDLARLKEYTEGVLRHEKTLQFLEQFASL